MYLPRNHPVTGFLTLYGLMDTSINYVDRRWSLSVKPAMTIGHSNAKATSFLLGKYNWTIKADNPNCNEGNEYVDKKLIVQ